jgi:hypothetical protein
MRKSLLCIAALFGMTTGFANALEVTVDAGSIDRKNVPVRVMMPVAPETADAEHCLLTASDGEKLIGQLTEPRVLAKPVETTEGSALRELTFILPELDRGQKKTYEITFPKELPAGTKVFHWLDKEDEYMDLQYGDRPVLRYMYEPYDDSTAENRERTYKVYHQVFNPRGTEIITKGVGGRYTHHRGLFYGFNRTTYDGKRVDIWHCTGDTHQSHGAFVNIEEGAVLGRQLLRVDWHGQNDEVFANELRELTAYNVPGGILIEFASRLKSAGPKIKVDGDPQHAGFHFRASNEVAAVTSKMTYFLRPDGKGEMGASRNWPGNKEHVNLPWNAMSFVVSSNRYTAEYMDHPDNPKEARYSERPYGRFGSYFVYEFAPPETLDVKYRIWLQDGEMTVSEATQRDNDFDNPVKADVR